MFLEGHNIMIDSIFAVDVLVELNIIASVNNHIYASYKGTISKNTAENLYEKLSNQSPVKIQSKDGANLFVGYPLDIRIHVQNDSHYLTVKCVSYSYLLDIKGGCQSFQDKNMNHKQVLKSSYNKFGDASILMKSYDDFAINTSIFQYNETHWELTLRLSARVNTVVYPDIIGDSPQVYLGIKENSAELKSYYNYREGYDTSKYLLHQKEREDIKFTDYFYCEFDSDSNYQLGETININNRSLVVVNKNVRLENDGIYINYRLSDIEPYIRIEKHNEDISGLTMAGTVIDTKKEMLKIHFNTDDEQDKKTAHWFGYRPITGNVMHTMPQIGTTVMFKFSSKNDDSGVATHVIHKDADDVQDMTKSSDRYYTTEFSKRMAMTPKTLYFNNKKENMILLGNDSGITIKTDTEVQLYSLKDLSIHSDGKITAIAPEQIYINKSGKDSVIEMSGSEINIESPNSVIHSNNNGPEKAYPNTKEQTITIGAGLASAVAGTVPAVSKIK